MKKILLFIKVKNFVFLIILVNSVIGYSQDLVCCFGMAGCTMDFGLPDHSQFVKIDTNNVWFITKAEKQILFPISPNNIYSLVTDTAAYYKSDIISSFNFKVCLGEGSFYSLIFFHKYDFEQYRDGGIVETSYDNGETWQNIIYDTVIMNNIEKTVNFYDASDTINSYDGQPGFTGLQSEYLASHIKFSANPDMYLDTMLLRFTIATDSIDSQNEGWMLDDFGFGGGWLGIIDHPLNPELLVYPNPANTLLNIQSGEHNILHVSILSVRGGIVIEKKGNNITSVNIAKLGPGIYLVKCCNSKDNCWISEFYKE
jgi:hypothetical protein